ncbi:Rv3235 family protein [Thermostaphylospora chromogena]|uniref:Uncharacterized protein n=1 Tax=Thermostaphylospora chromogena TaxID=35622 RepID=A0A1H1EMT8_9ACTN|nr:hypothetical protein SAMN04489764_2544 [Thermostaphylospora chromogena]
MPRPPRPYRSAGARLLELHRPRARRVRLPRVTSPLPLEPSPARTIDASASSSRTSTPISSAAARASHPARSAEGSAPTALPRVGGASPASPTVQGALAFAPALDAPAGAAPARPAREPRTADVRAGARRALETAVGHDTPGERWLRMFGQAFAEVLAGRRPPGTIAAHTTRAAYAEVLRAGRIIDAPRPPFAAAPHVCVPRPGVIEMCLLIHGGRRPRVLALRLERRGVQWVCTDFETTP